MKLFKVYPECATIDEYASFVIVAEDKDTVINMLVHEDDLEYGFSKTSIKLGSYDVYFYDTLGKIIIEEVDLNKTQIVETRFF